MKTGIIRKARPGDAPVIKAVIDEAAKDSEVLPRSLSEIYDQVRDFWVVEEGEAETVVGCAALHVVWQDLAEIKSVAVLDGARGRGLGEKLVRQCIDEAASMDLPTVFVLTAIPDFFERFGFQEVDRATLPHKIWAECIRCAKFPDCCEIAMTLELKRQPA